MKLICQLIKNQNQPSLLSEIGSVILCIAAALSTAEAQTDAFELQPALPAISTTLVDPAVIENADKGDAALRLQLLETYEELYNWPMTKALAEMILHKDGAENAPALSAVTNAYLRMKDGDRALQAATRLVKIIDSPETQALQAQALILLGRHSEAAAVFRKVKSAGKKDALFQWQEELAFALFNAGKNKESRKAFQEILDQKDYSSRLKATAKKQVRLMQALDAQHWMHEGENDKAVAILEKLKRSGEGTFEFQEDLAFAYQNAGKLDEARKAFESITRSAGYDARAKSNARDQINLLDSLQAEYLKDQGDYEQALSLLNNLKKRFRNAIFPFQDQLAYTLVDSGEVESAREAFQEIVSNKAYPADQRNTARLEIQSIEVGNLITKGYAALEGRVNWRQARQVDALLMNRHSTHPDAIAFHASILSLSGRCDKAIQVLEQLRDAQFKDKQFPHAGLLAECYYQTGEVKKAKAAYREAFEMPAIEAAEQIALRDSYQGFRRETRPTLSASVTARNEDAGNTLSSEIEARVPFGAGWAIGAEASHMETDGDNRQEILATVEKNWGPGYFAQVKAGTNDGTTAYAAAIGKKKRALGSTAWTASYHKNETADDTAELSSEGGVQERAAIDVQHDVTPSLRLTAGSGYRSVETGKKDLGSGYDLNVEAAYGWNLANSRQRAFEVAYVTDASSFDNKTADSRSAVTAAADVEGELIDSDYHRHGAEVRWFGNYGKIEPYMMAGGYYRVDEGSFEYEVGGGLDYDVNEDTTIYVRGHYNSSGEGQNTGVGIVEGQIGVERTF